MSAFARCVTADDEELAARRLDQCARCPKHGGACDADDEMRKPGYGPVWTGGGIDFRSCKRWPEYTLREKLHKYGLPLDYCGCTFDSYNAANAKQIETIASLREFVEAFDVLYQPLKGLYLVGARGVGKTHLAAALVRELVATHRARTVYFAAVPDLIYWLDYDRPWEQREETMQSATESDLLVLDDLGAESTTEFQQKHLGMIVAARDANRRATVVTSNEQLDRFETTLGPRAYSRLQALVAVHCHGRHRARSRKAQ